MQKAILRSEARGLDFWKLDEIPRMRAIFEDMKRLLTNQLDCGGIYCHIHNTAITKSSDTHGDVHGVAGAELSFKSDSNRVSTKTCWPGDFSDESTM